MNRPSQRGSWLLAWAVSALAGTAAYRLWGPGQAGNDGACLASALLWLVSARSFFTGLARWDFAAEMRALRRLSAEPSRVHGEAKWGSLKDAKEAGMLEGPGVLLGRLDGRPIWNPGTHTTTIASTGCGKGVGVVIPTLLTHPGSMVVVDVKGELAAVCGRARRELGNDVVVLNPFREKLARELGVDLGDTRYNPLSLLKPGPEVKDEAELVASWLIPGQPGMTDSEKYWTDLGQTILAGVMLHLVSLAGEEPITLPQLRRTLMVPADELIDLLTEMAVNAAFGGLVAEYGGRLCAMLKNSPKEFSGGNGSAQKALRIFDGFGQLGAHVSGDEFDFGAVKKRPTTVFIVLPPDRDTHAAWMNLVISSAIEVISRDRTTKPVLFVLDEFANLGFLPGILRAMALSRSAGLRFHLVLQQLSQAERIYGKGWKEIVGLSECIHTFGVWEPETLRYLSEWAGQETVRDVSFNARAGEQFDGELDVSLGSADRARALVRPEEIRRLGRDRQLVFYRNAPPFKAELASYLDDRALLKRADPNPYHRKTPAVRVGVA